MRLASATPLCLLALISLLGCSSKPAAQSPSAGAARQEHRQKPALRTAAGPSGPGSSDGMTCEEARDSNVDEVRIGKKGERDLSEEELGNVLNTGTFLGECEVPADTKVEVCTAVKNGSVVGVTVGLSPPDTSLEKCVASRVRGIAFPSHPKMDIVRTSF